MIPSWSNSLKLMCHLSFVSDKLMFHTLVFVIQDLHLCTSGPGRLTPKSCNWYGLLIDTPPLVVGYAGSLGSSLKHLRWNKPCSRFDNQKVGNLKKKPGVPRVVGLIGPLSKYLGWNKLCLRSTEGRGRGRKEGGRKKEEGFGERRKGIVFCWNQSRDNLAPRSSELLISLLCLHYFCLFLNCVYQINVNFHLFLVIV